MIILTDNRDWADTLLDDLVPEFSDPVPQVENWQDLTVNQLPTDEQRLWVGLNGLPKLSRCKIIP